MIAGFGGLGYELALDAVARLLGLRRMSPLEHPPLAPLDVAGRLPRLRGRLESQELDALIVTNLTNLRYLTGFTGSAGIVVVTPEQVLLTTDGRYRTQSAEQLEAAGVEGAVELVIGGGDEQHAAITALRRGSRTSGARGR